MRSTIRCCKDCDKRHLGCHTQCETYKEQKKNFEETKAEWRKQKELENGLNTEQIKNVCRSMGIKRKQV